MEIEITLYNADGRVVERSIGEAQTASVDEINEMVTMIENGTPAWLAAAVVIPRGER